jgi:hypothetical protein
VRVFAEGAQGRGAVAVEETVAELERRDGEPRFYASLDASGWTGWDAPVLVAVAHLDCALPPGSEADAGPDGAPDGGAPEPVRRGLDVESAPVVVYPFGFSSDISSAVDAVPHVWAFVDFDGDGDSDLLWSNTLLRNDGRWPFVDVTAEAFADYCAARANRGTCHREEPGREGELLPQTGEHCAAADMDGDGVLDLVLGRHAAGELLGVARGRVEGGFWRASGEGVPLCGSGDGVASACVPGGASALVADFDLDGWLDVLTTQRCHQTGPVDSPGTCATSRSDTPPRVFRNLGTRDGEWAGFDEVPRGEAGLVEGIEHALLDTPVASTSGAYYLGPAAAGDLVGNDGYPDVVLTRELGFGAMVFRNVSTARAIRFEAVPTAQLPSISNVQLADYDADGDLDMVFPFGVWWIRPSLWRNRGDAFENRTAQVQYRGGLLVDLNNDGLLDAGGALNDGRDRFAYSGVGAEGVPLRLLGDGVVHFVRGALPDEVIWSHLSGTGRLVARVEVPALLPGNSAGVGTRVRVSEGPCPTEPLGCDEPGAGIAAEIGPVLAGALSGLEVSIGADPSRPYCVDFRLPTPECVRVTCDTFADGGPVRGSSRVVLTGAPDELECVRW